VTKPRPTESKAGPVYPWSATGQLLLRRWAAFVVYRPWLTLVISALLTIALASYAFNHLGISTSTEDMIDNNLGWRQNIVEFRNQFPEHYRAIAVVIDAQTEALAQAAAVDLDQRLAVNNESITSRFSPTVSPPLAGRELLLLGEDELLQVADDLAAAQPFFGKLRQQFRLAELFDLLTLSYREDPAAVPDALARKLISTIDANTERVYPLLDWSRLNSDKETPARRIVLVSVVVDKDQPRPARRILASLREQGLATTAAFDGRVHVRLTGTIALEDAELVSVSENSRSTALLALVSVCVILLLAFRSWRLLLICIVTLLTGLVATAAFAAATVVKLNIISIAFAILYIGLGVDFIIHYLLRLREVLSAGSDLSDALIETSGQVGGALSICVITTAAGFFAFMPTAFVGVSQLGLISGTGMFISLIVTLTLLPAI